MKNKLIYICTLSLTLIFALGLTCSAKAYTVSDLENVSDGIIQYYGEGSVQDVIDNTFVSDIGGNAEWYAISLANTGKYDFSKYETALVSYLEKNSVSSASTRLKYALTLYAVGSNSEYIEKTLDDSTGKLGIMSYAFGLHLLNNGVESELFSTESVINTLLSLQRQDGSWGLGNISDVDITAMTLQALAPHYDKMSNVHESVDKALDFLSKAQLDDGEYHSYGIKNSESTSQVIIALSALDIDVLNDARFIKGEYTLFDVLMRYRCENNGFSHTLDTDANGKATVQAFCAINSYLNMKNGKGSMYLFDREPILDIEAPDNVVETDTVEDTTEDITEISNISSENKGNVSYKVIAISVTVIVAGVVAIVLVALKKRHIANFVILIIAMSLIIALILFTDIKTPDEYYSDTDTLNENVIGNASMLISCKSVAGKNEYAPENGYILENISYEIYEGDTVYSLFLRVMKENKIQFENSGSEKLAYIAGINYLYEFDFGDLSGWVYTVNGEQVSVGCSECKIYDGDVIEWHYTVDLGKDIK